MAQTIINTQIAIRAFQANSRKAVTAAANEWRNGIVEVLTGDRTGRVYRTGRGTATYRASAPGEAPASRTGVLRSSYRIQVISDTEAQVGSTLDRSLYLEKGTTRIRPRPHIIPGFNRKRDAIMDALTKHWN